MDRMSFRDPGEHGLARISANHFNHNDAFTKDETITGFAPERFAAYEDTGMMPDEIAALKEEIEAIHTGQVGGYNVYQLANLLHYASEMDARKDEQIATLKAENERLRAELDDRKARWSEESYDNTGYILAHSHDGMYTMTSPRGYLLCEFFHDYPAREKEVPHEAD